MAKTTPETVLEPVSKEDETAPKRVLRTSKERFSAFRTYAETLELERNELTDRLDSSEGVLDLNTLYVRAQNAGVGLSFEDIKRYCFSAELPSFNPIRRYFQRLPIWDEIDHIASLCHHIQVPDPTRLHTQLKKWLARALRQVFEPERFNKQMLVLVSSGQNPGKTTLLRWLIPTALAEHYCENPDIADKDARIAIARSLLVSFDEVAVLLRNRHAFKALISAGANTVRLPYTASPTRLERLASFVATSNEYDFIHDETGSVRYLCFEVASINHSYTNAVDINKLWAQAYALYKSNAPIDLTAEELRENALANDTFTTQPEAAELVRRFFRPCKARELPSHHLSATELKDILSERHAWFRTVPEVSLGKALRALLGPSKSQGDDGVKRYAMIKTASITW